MPSHHSAVLKAFQSFRESLPNYFTNSQCGMLGLCLIALTSMSLRLLSRKSKMVKRVLLISLVTPLTWILDVWRIWYRSSCRRQLSMSKTKISSTVINNAEFPGEHEFEQLIEKLDMSGLRSTGSKAHISFVDWIKAELAKLDGIVLTEDSFDILRWQTRNGVSLQEAGRLTLGQQSVPIAGVVPFSAPTRKSGIHGKLYHLPSEMSFSSDVVGKIILRPLPNSSVPYALGFLPSYSRTTDLNTDVLKSYERPSFWEHPMHNDLVAAAKYGAAAVIFLSDIPTDQLKSYWDPHQGTHYRCPALLVGHDEADVLRNSINDIAHVVVDAEISAAQTSNVFATLPGQSSEQIIYASHTDGNTCVQENGVAALLILAKYFVTQPLSRRRRTIIFAFNTAHLHVSKEGSGRHAQQLDMAYDKTGDVTLVIPIEHMGTREIEAHATSSSGRRLSFTGRGEMMFWCVGPSLPVLAAVEQAVQRRNLDRVLITRGTSVPKLRCVPVFDSFGGLGTLYHNFLVPTTSLISGPWSLFAPSFGREAVDVGRMRKQTLAVGDLYFALEKVTRDEIVGDYAGYRQQRAQGVCAPGFVYPPETI